MPTFPIREAIPATPRAHILRLDLQGQSFPYPRGPGGVSSAAGCRKATAVFDGIGAGRDRHGTV